MTNKPASEYKELIKMYRPKVIDFSYMYAFSKLDRMSIDSLSESYKELERSFGQYKRAVEYKYSPNNWLKRHHKPMRRKRQGTRKDSR